MFQSSHWEESTPNKWVFCANDNSPLDRLSEKVDIEALFYPVNDEQINLGIRRINGRPFSGNYIGLCNLKGYDGRIIKTFDGREVALRIDPRFEISVVDMLNVLRDDDEFERYLAPQTTRLNQQEQEIYDTKNNELFYFFDSEDPIYVSDYAALNSSIISVTIFLVLLKNLCNKPLMGKMLTREENLVGKAKGKILFKQNVRYNTLRGRDDRLYCRYLQYSEDILENRILRAALQKASLFIQRYLGSVSGTKNSYRDMITFCQKSLSHVSLQTIGRQDYGKAKFTGCYVYYRPVINAAKMVLSEITLGATGESRFTSYVIPYAVSMEKLFEMYVRASLKKAGVKSYQDTGSGIYLYQYDYKSGVLTDSGEYVSNYISGNVKPDIILFNSESGKRIVFDVKYKNLQNGRYSRSDRLQALAYAMMFDCDYVGLIFPPSTTTTSTFYLANPIQTAEKRNRYYCQLELSIDKKWDCQITSKYDGSKLNMLDYLSSLLA